MTQQEMKQFIDTDNFITYNSVQVDLNNGTTLIGFFIHLQDYHELMKSNKWRFIQNNHAQEYGKTTDISLAIMIEGESFSKLTLL